MPKSSLKNVPKPSSRVRNKFSGTWGTYLFGRTIYPAGGLHGPRLQDAYQLLITIQGSLRVTVGRTTYELSPGEAILLHPGHQEFYQFSEKSECTWCQIWPELLLREDKRVLKDIRGIHRLPSSLHLLIEEGLAVQNPHSTVMEHALGALGRTCLLRFAAHAVSFQPGDHPVHPAYERAREIAASDFSSLRSAEDLAQRAGVSTSQLRFLFRQANGESPSRMIWRLKVEYAVQLIRSTGFTLGEIAGQCGYANAFHLSRSVKRFTGYTPRDLRRLEWKNPALTSR